MTTKAYCLYCRAEIEVDSSEVRPKCPNCGVQTPVFEQPINLDWPDIYLDLKHARLIARGQFELEAIDA